MPDDLKLANTEAYTLIKLHASTIFQWANTRTTEPVSPKIREAMMATVARMYEVIEGLPIVDEKHKLH